MWSASEDPPDAMEGEPPEAMAHTKEKCEQNKNQLESLKEIMMRNQQSLKKKEEEVQEYARRLSKIKSRARLSRRSKEGSSSSKDTVHSPKTESTAIDTTDDTIDDISQAKTPKAKSSLLQRKLAENRKAFEQRSKELTETKRAVEEKVEAIRQQLEETDLASMEMHKDQLPVTPVRPLMVTSDIMSPIQIQDIQEKENKIVELSNKILELEATVLDLQENLKEKDSVIDSKTKAVTLMSADLSKKGKTTLDILEDTKDEMRTMQENFVLIETSLKNKNASLLEQLKERDNRISELEHTINGFEEQLKEQKIAESVSADFSRSTMDTLAETKDAMKSMQENFVFIESSLKLKNDNLLQQLEEYEIKLAESKERIFQLESGTGIVTAPAVEDLQFRIERLEQNNRQLLDEKYELQKNIAEMQDQIIAGRSTHDNSEKDNKISELEDLIEGLKRSNELLEAESKAELHKYVTELSSKKEEYSNIITDLEENVHKLEAEKNEIAEKLSDERTMLKEDDKVIKLTKELEDLNKSMIKLKAQHRSKIKNLQKQLENFKMVSDTNAELVRLGNQVALLEEEKGNLQLSLVDFDELKASAGDWQERVADLENKVSSQTKEIQMHIDAIATLENQKLDLMQELHTVKQEVSALEAENAESENLRVTAEMKVVELEEQLEAAHKEQSDNKLESLSESEYHELLKKIDALTQENSELYSKLGKIEEKNASDTGSTESFEAIQVNDRNDLLKKIEELEQKNNELTIKLTKLEEKDSSHAGSTESFETINDTDRSELLKKIEQLTQENSDLTMKLSRIEEKGSSDTGSTESFERIPEHNESTTKIELLTQENHELVIKLTKLEEQLSQMESSAQLDVAKKIDDTLETLRQENDYLTEEISKLKQHIEELTKENSRLQDHMEKLTAEKFLTSEMVKTVETAPQVEELMERQQISERELAQVPMELSINVTSCATDDMKSQIAMLEKENARMATAIAQLEEYIDSQKEKLSKVTREKEELDLRLERVACDDFAKERLELIDKLEKLNREKESVAQERHDLHEQISTLLQKSSDEISEMRKTEEAACQESQAAIVTVLEKEVENSKVLVVDYKNQMEEMNMKIQSMEAELQEKTRQMTEHEASTAKLESLERELKDMFATAEEWKFKYDDMQIKMQVLEEGKTSIEEAFRTLDNNNKELLEVIKEKDVATATLQERLQDTIESLETRLQDEVASLTMKEREIVELQTVIETKNQELHAKYAQLQNEMIAIDSLQDELNSCTMKLKENETALSLSLEEVTRLNNIIRENEKEIETLRNNISEMNETSKPLAEFNEILESLQSIETNYTELQNKHESVLKANDDLSRQIEDMSRRDDDLKNELMKKEQEIADLFTAKENIAAQIEEITNHKTEAERKNWELQTILDNQTAYVEKVQLDLTNEYKQMEHLKIKHTEDITMLNRRLEDVIEELAAKVEENEGLKAELEQTEELVDKNVTEETKTGLEDKIVELEQKLSESENKLQAQSEKMKKIVATFNKKKVVCQELEARVAELEEKWTTEKDEKEVNNKKIQEVEISMREKDNKIADLEEKLLQTKNDAAETLMNSEKLAKESSSLKEKMIVLMEQIAEMGDEIEKQRAEMDRLYQQVEVEKTMNEDIVRQYDHYKETVKQESEQKQVVLDEVKEEARELSVRMQVMETEYVEQLALIKNLQAENGLLSSKQTQINEKLENAEKESEERRVLIEQLQKRIVATMTVGVQIPEEDTRESDARDTQRCDHSEQCQNLVQALETRLQERQAEIENLNNELANSYGNIVLLHDESVRYNDMMMQTAQERFNQSLMDRTNTLQQEIESLKTEKSMSERRVSELEAELDEYRHKSAESKAEVSRPIDASITEDQHQQERDDTPQLFDASKIFGATVTSEADISDKNEIARLQSLLNEREAQCSQLMKEIDLLVKSTEEERSYVQKLQAQCDDQVGHWKNRLEDVQDELKRMERLHSEKVDSLNAELSKATLQANELKSLQEQYYNAQADSERLGQLVSEKNTQIDSLVAELSAVSQQLNAQLLHTNVEADLQTEMSVKNNAIIALETELTSTKQTVETLTAERDQQNRILELYRLQIENLEIEARNVNDNDLIRSELEQRVSAATTERDLLQLQVNDLTRSLEELQESLATQRNLQIELENALHEKDQAQVLVANLTRALEDSQRSLQESKIHEQMHQESAKELTSVEKQTVQQESEQISIPVEEPVVHQEHIQVTQVHAEKEASKQQETPPFDVDLKWDNGSSEKLNVDEESWGWSTEDAQLAGDQHLGDTITLFPDAEIRLRAQIEDLQDRIKDLETQNAKIVEESKAAQVKSGKLVKKLKEYKVQVESLQQQLKTQKQADSFFDLDTAIEEELKTQIVNLEKALNEIKEEKKNIVAEKEAFLKRFDVVVSANERYMEMKERQDMEIEVLRIQNKELGNKVQSLEWRLQDNATGMEEDNTSSQYEVQQTDNLRHEVDTTIVHDRPQKDPTDDLEIISRKYKEEIDDLKDELEALAAENEQLQHFLEEQKTTITSLESKMASTGELTEKLEILNNQHAQSQSALNKSKEEYDILRKQYEQSLMDANDQVAAMRQNSELLRIEFLEKIERLELEVSSLQKALEEKEALEAKISALTSSEEKYSTINASLMEVTELLNARVQEVADLKQELQNQYVERQQAEAALQLEMQNLTRELDERKRELTALSQTCSDKEHELLQQRSVETVNTIVSEATQELVQKHAIEIERKDKELHDLTEKLSMLQLMADEYISRLRDNVFKLETQQQQIAYLKEDLIERDSIIESTKTDVDLTNEKLREKQEELTRRDEEHSKLTTELKRCLTDIQHLQSRLSATEESTIDLQECHSRIHSLEQQIQALNSEKELILSQHDEETKTYQTHLESNKHQIDALKHDLREKTEQLHYLNAQLCAKENDLEGIKSMMIDKDSLLDITTQELKEKQAELERLRNEQPQSSKIIDGLPVFRMGNDDDAELQKTIDELKTQMEAKQQELEHLKYVLSENTYPMIIQQMQDRINCLYNEKATLETSLRTTTQTLTEKQEQVHLLTQRINGQNQEHVSKEEANMLSRDRRSAHDQEEIVRLQNELHAKEQEINELKYVIAEKDSQLCLQASMEPQSDEFELRETLQRLTGELYGKDQEVQTLKATIATLQEELSRLKNIERLSEESKNTIEKLYSTIERLYSEKEQIRVEAEESLKRELQRKEAEIGEIKQRLSEENQQLLAEFRLKDSDIENLRTQLTQLQDDWSDRLQRKENELMQMTDGLTEKERKLAELSITKDTVFHNLKMQINEKEVRIEELLALCTEEEKQLNELRQILTARETEVNTLKQLLEQKVAEYEVIQHALKKDVSVIEAAASKSPDITQTSDKEVASNELDLALYMLHQRDVRCEELTHELMQLLEERDTLQLRLSNAIRVNEELRRASSVEASPTKDPTPLTIVEPVVEQPSPSKSEGPVEIAKEAIDDPMENKEALALKLSQLHSVSHTKDVRLKDERELRHTQQMSLLAHRDVLSTLPPEAAARLVNANYTLSRDVRSQSSVLLNWLWGKSTPKVVHM
ncbi:golgin subfamily A member 4-like isoform X3 [Odontomachus brunneus]|nr:golgin subfamily A member 4-like isoform X3 [Odontomachus brunneus]XP_032687304.1 golgin subfamily A member 4-like isoform X3 [Odontomachus brunneus]XP_032687314.1 golgin subfamily A member 4-like isoform X3 [Odontomachus brunneus]